MQISRQLSRGRLSPPPRTLPPNPSVMHLNVSGRTVDLSPAVARLPDSDSESTIRGRLLLPEREDHWEPYAKKAEELCNLGEQEGLLEE